MALLRIELRLQPSPTGERELARWPQAKFTPDFLVAASGQSRFELDDRLIGLGDDANQPLAVPADQLETSLLNFWLPDYTAGFALNLAQAALRLKTGERTSATAKFIDEALDLKLEKLPPSQNEATLPHLRVSFRYSAEVIGQVEAPLVLVMAEIGRTLQDFVVQLLSLNPHLVKQEDVRQLREMIAQLVN